MSDFIKRVYLSLWCGLTLPFIYFLLLMVLDSVFDHLLSHAWRGLLLPLTWLGEAFTSVYHPTVQSVGDVFGAATDVILVTVVGNVIFYSALSFLLLSVRATLKLKRE